jgi:hypothetical protein
MAPPARKSLGYFIVTTSFLFFQQYKLAAAKNQPPRRAFARRGVVMRVNFSAR